MPCSSAAADPCRCVSQTPATCRVRENPLTDVRRISTAEGQARRRTFAVSQRHYAVPDRLPLNRRTQFTQKSSSFDTTSLPLRTLRRTRTLVGWVHVKGARTITTVGVTPKTSAGSVQTPSTRNSTQVPLRGEQVLP